MHPVFYQLRHDWRVGVVAGVGAAAFLFSRTASAEVSGNTAPALAPAAAWPAAPPAAAPAASSELPSAPASWVSTMEADGPPVTLSSASFEITAPDRASAKAVLELTERLHGLLQTWFVWPEADARHVQVFLVPEARADFTTPFTVATAADGHRILSVRWGEDTKLSDTCLALSTAGLEAIVYYQHGPEAGGRVPDWLKIAFAKMLEVAIKPMMVDNLLEDAATYPSLSLRQIMTARGPYDNSLPVLEVNAYWLLRFLIEEEQEIPGQRKLLGDLAAGADPATALQAAFPGKFSDPATLELWWRVGYVDMLDEREPPILPLAQTRDELDRLQQVSVNRAGKSLRVRADEAWPDRHEPDFGDLVVRRLEELHTLRPRANPAYNNALLSLMAVFDKLRGSDADAFHKAWAQYQTDRALAESVENDVNGALSGN